MADTQRTAKLKIAIISSVVRIEQTSLRFSIETELEGHTFPFAKYLHVAFFQEKPGHRPEDIAIAQFRAVRNLVHLAFADAEAKRRKTKHEAMAEEFNRSGNPGIEHFARPRRHD